MRFKHNGTVNLGTERLLLRRFNFNDVDSMLNNWISNPIVQSNYEEPTYESKDAVGELLNKWIPQYESDSFYRWAIILKETNENIGQVAFCRVYTEIEIAELEYCIGEEYWGNNYVSEALKIVLKYSFEKLGFSKLEAFHKIENPNSGRVLQKIAMKMVSNVERFEINNEQPIGYTCYGLTKDEYFLK